MRIGVLGAGQLGRMLALAAHPIGIEVRCLTDRDESCAAPVCRVDRAPFDDLDALRAWARGCDAVTFEFENVPVRAAEAIAAVVPVRPGVRALATAQDRVAEKELFATLAIPTPRWAPIGAPADVSPALERVGLPAVIKTRRDGYDGKGQRVVRTPEEARAACEDLLVRCAHGLVCEALVDFASERSVLAVRATSGQVRTYPVVTNVHEDAILRRSSVDPARPPRAGAAALAAAERLARELDYVGVLALEMFELPSGELLANEFAPRVHNSGHWTIEGAVTSQFENHLRAVAGWPLGETGAIGGVRMTNLIGTAPPPPELLADPRAHLHLYDKAPAPGRKIGHVTVVDQPPPSGGFAGES